MNSDKMKYLGVLCFTTHPFWRIYWDHNQKIFNTTKNCMILLSPYVMWICHVCGSRKRSPFPVVSCAPGPQPTEVTSQLVANYNKTSRFMTLHPGRLNKFTGKMGEFQWWKSKTFKLLILQSFASQGLRRKSLMIFGYLWIFSYWKQGGFS